MPCWDHKKADANAPAFLRSPLSEPPAPPVWGIFRPSAGRQKPPWSLRSEICHPPRRCAAVPRGTLRPPLRSRPVPPGRRIAPPSRHGADAPSLRSNILLAPVLRYFYREVASYSSRKPSFASHPFSRDAKDRALRSASRPGFVANRPISFRDADLAPLTSASRYHRAGTAVGVNRHSLPTAVYRVDHTFVR